MLSVLKTVERLFESADDSRVRTRLKFRWLHHVHLLVELALQEDVLYIHLMEGYALNGSHLCHLGKGLFVIDPMCLRIPFCHKPGLISIDGAVGMVFHLKYPPTTDRLLVG